MAHSSLVALRETQARQIDQLAHLIKIYGEDDEGIHKQEGYVVAMAEYN